MISKGCSSGCSRCSPSPPPSSSISTVPSSPTRPTCSLRMALSRAARGTGCVTLGRVFRCSMLRMCLLTASTMSVCSSESFCLWARAQDGQGVTASSGRPVPWEPLSAGVGEQPPDKQPESSSTPVTSVSEDILSDGRLTPWSCSAPLPRSQSPRWLACQIDAESGSQSKINPYLSGAVMVIKVEEGWMKRHRWAPPAGRWAPGRSGETWRCTAARAGVEWLSGKWAGLDSSPDSFFSTLSLSGFSLFVPSLFLSL